MPVSAPQTRVEQLREVLGQRVLVADGAMGTMLYAKRGFLHRCYDEMNLSLPAMVRDVHQAYVRAGAEILETNTFGANRMRLQPFGFAEKVRAINHAGVRIAREAARDQAFVAGAVGPLGVRLAPLGQISPDEARAIFREQISALVEAGIDLLMFETFRDLNELNQAVCAAREIGAATEDRTGLIVAALVSIENDGRLENGADAAGFTRALDQMPVEIMGLNCSSGPNVMLETIETMAQHTNKILCAMPNAGLPVAVDGRNVYLCSPEYMGQYASRFMQAGAKIVGGCCGTTPEHIQEIGRQIRQQVAQQVQSFDAPQAASSVTVDEPALTQPMEPVPLAQKSGLGAKLAERKFVISIEILPPRGPDAANEIAAARSAKAAGFDCVNVPDGPRATSRMSAQVSCELIQHQAGIEAVLHFTCRDRNVLGIQSDLLGAHAAGVRNLLCITGDPPRTGMGLYPDATPVFDVDSIGLVRIASHLNQGLDLGGHALGSQTSLLLGVGVNPGALDLDRELRRFEAKVAAGAEFAITQPVFDLNLLEAFLKRIEEFRIPVVAGIWPLANLGSAEFLVNELRVPVPEEFIERMRNSADAEAARAEGIAIAREIVARVRPMVAGVQIGSPSGRYQMAIEVAEAAIETLGSRD
jgi:methionine synthase I (cobalamin-dependent)/5,10-methylenetetrahydrofolate reductase